jgi:hypothetical protein
MCASPLRCLGKRHFEKKIKSEKKIDFNFFFFFNFNFKFNFNFEFDLVFYWPPNPKLYGELCVCLKYLFLSFIHNVPVITHNFFLIIHTFDCFTITDRYIGNNIKKIFWNTVAFFCNFL